MVLSLAYSLVLKIIDGAPLLQFDSLEVFRDPFLSKATELQFKLRRQYV